MIRSNISKAFACILFFTVIIALFTGCNKSATDKQTLRWAVGAEPESLDPRKFQSISSSLVADQLFEGLCSEDSNSNIIPAAAEKWDVSPDGLVYTFHLRSDACWSNGDPVTAYDFEYAWKTTLDPRFASPYSVIMYFLKNGEAYNTDKASADDVGVQVLDNLTLKVTLERPIPFFLNLTTFHTYFPVNKKIAAANDKWSASPNSFVSNGPFKLDIWEHNQRISLSPNPKYWDKDAVKLTKVDCMLIDNGTTALSMFENKQLDLSDVAPTTSEMPRLLSMGTLKTAPMIRTYYYELNNRNKPLDDPRVRTALSLALERSRLIAEDKKAGTATEAFAWVPYGIPDAKANTDFRKIGGNYISEDVAKARQLLAEAGFPDGKNFPELTLLFPSGSPIAKMSCETVQEMWKKNLNINILLINQEAKVFYSSLENGSFDIARTNWVGDYLDPLTFMDVYLKGSSYNSAGYVNPAYDALIAQVNSTADNNQRMQLFHQAEAMLMKDMPMIPYAFGNNVYLDNNLFIGIFRNATGKCLLKNVHKK